MPLFTPRPLLRREGSIVYDSLGRVLIDSIPPKRSIEIEGFETKTRISTDRAHEINGVKIPQHFDITTWVPGEKKGTVEKVRITYKGEVYEIDVEK
ncbi:MAG: hypothetical protein QW227_01680 [Candidatus Aenigmatarchaeota archaeon]|nr:hypothetical protein [Candidatus Aenigmarchaeota archaeon]